jgi:hypothetical protein
MAVSLVAALGCGDDDDNDDAAAGSGGSAGSGEGGSAAAAVLDTLQGTWAKACMASEDGDGSESESFAFDGNDVTAKIENFGDTACANALFVIEFKGGVEMGGLVSGSDDTYEVDFPLTGFTATIVNAAMVDRANQAALLGFTDWSYNSPRDLFGADVFENGDPVESTDVVYAILRVDGDQLFMGDSGDDGPETVEADRPTTLEADPYIKQ